MDLKKNIEKNMNIIERNIILRIKEGNNMNKIFNKLVRDEIPQIIEKNNEKAITTILNDEEYRRELLKKLREECEEVINAKNTNEILEELADVYEVLFSIAKLENMDICDIIEVANKKRNVKGGFDKRIFLIETK